MADWSNLSHDLLRKISESFLATQDLDYYTDFRFVCREWRRATPKPTLDDPRFMASKWMMLKREDDGGFLSFVNLATGRFLRKRLPCLRGFFFVSAAAGSGLLVVGERAPPHETRVINPFTGARVCFRAPIPVEKVRAVVVVTSSSPMTVFVSGISGYLVSWIDQSSDSFDQGEFSPRWPEFRRNSHMTLFDGEVHLHTESGSIISSRSTTYAVDGEEGGSSLGAVLEQQRPAPAPARTVTMGTAIANASPSYVEEAYRYSYYLVESEGELLLVRLDRYCFEEPVVYKVDTVNKVVVPVKSIGGRALFVSELRCFSVDASKFNTVEAGSIYRVSCDCVVSYDYDGRTKGCRWLGVDLGTECLHCCCRPLTLPEFFASCCTDDGQLSELEMMLHYGVVE